MFNKNPDKSDKFKRQDESFNFLYEVFWFSKPFFLQNLMID